jgi:hypothetical protein
VQVREFERPGRAATAPIFADEATPPPVTLPDRALQDRGNRAARAGRHAARRVGLARFVCLRRLLLSSFGEQRAKCAFQDEGGIAVGDLVRQKILQFAKLVVGLLVEGDFELVAAGGQRRRVRRARGA